MNLDFNLNLTQEQKLIMTQEMQLSVKLLQMSAFELSQYIEKEMQENPVLEADVEHNSELDNLNNKIDYKEFIEYLDFDNYDHHSSYEKPEENDLNPLNFVSEEKSLREHLLEQIDLMHLDKNTRDISKYIIENLNEKGYLEVDIDYIAEELNKSEQEISYALEVVQSLEPVGIAARSLQECLNLQLKRKGYEEEELYIIVDKYLDFIAENKYSLLAKNLNIDVKKAQEYGDIVKSLEPKPTRGYYTGEEISYIIPDAYISKVDGESFIIMNDEIVPKLSINNLYKDIIKNQNDKHAVDFVQEKLNNAIFLIKSIEHRKSTIHRVIEKILEIQKDYFEKDSEFLKPMTLKEIAEELDLHESTVSRAIRDKYVSTSKGTIKIKDLFTTGISTNMSEDLSTNLIKKRIEEIVASEDKSKPLSDQVISEMLIKEDMNISRRTVAKYREELNIKSSSKRKRY